MQALPRSLPVVPLIAQVLLPTGVLRVRCSPSLLARCVGYGKTGTRALTSPAPPFHASVETHMINVHVSG